MKDIMSIFLEAGTFRMLVSAIQAADLVDTIRSPGPITVFAPNDEAFAGHPLSSRGLRPYGAFEVHDSSWIHQLEHMNSVHPYHRRERYLQLRHFILSFHDSTFECVAPRYEITRHEGPLDRVGEWMHAQLRR